MQTNVECVLSSDLCQTWLGVTRRVYYKKQEMLTLRKQICSHSSFFSMVRIAHHFIFLCCVFGVVYLRLASCFQCCLCL